MAAVERRCVRQAGRVAAGATFICPPRKSLLLWHRIKGDGARAGGGGGGGMGGVGWVAWLVTVTASSSLSLSICCVDTLVARPAVQSITMAGDETKPTEFRAAKQTLPLKQLGTRRCCRLAGGGRYRRRHHSPASKLFHQYRECMHANVDAGTAGSGLTTDGTTGTGAVLSVSPRINRANRSSRSSIAAVGGIRLRLLARSSRAWDARPACR